MRAEFPPFAVLQHRFRGLEGLAGTGEEGVPCRNVLTDRPFKFPILPLRDVALYDTDGCMSPVGVVTPEALDAGALDALAAAMQAAEQRWPRGAIRPEDAATIRARAFLARAFGQVREGPAWTVLQLPPRLFSPFALPRVLTVYPGLTDLEPYAALLGTVAGSAPDADARRFCALGAMQTPPHDGTHEGIDVLGAIARLPGPTPIST